MPQLAALGASLPRVGQTLVMRTTNLPLGGPVFQLLGVSDADYAGTPDRDVINAAIEAAAARG